MKIYILLFIILFTAIGAKAQSRILPVLESPTSPKSLSLGNSKMGNMDISFIYNNPTAIFSSAPINADYSLGFIPSDEYTYKFHTLSGGYRRGKSGFMIGGRYLSMGAYDSWLNDNMETEPLGKIRFYSYTIDLGYAYKLDDTFSFYSTMGYAEEKTISSIRAYRLDVGINYNRNNTLFGKNIDYSVGLSVANLGRYTYHNNSDYMAPDIRLGGSVLMPTAANQNIELFIEGNAFLPVSDNKFSSSFACGVDYSFYRKYSLRVGGHCGEQDDFFSAGFGIKYSIFDLSFGSKISLRKDLNNIYMVGLKISI